ncbi:MAG: alanine:cation symporter family protein [Alistipes sp.]|nr:alanine:cation symporter family protein [Candidatus Alistipes equi]
MFNNNFNLAKSLAKLEILISIVIIGATTAADTVWLIGDIGMGLSTYINVIALLLLFPEALALLKDFESKHQKAKTTDK